MKKVKVFEDPLTRQKPEGKRCWLKKFQTEAFSKVRGLSCGRSNSSPAIGDRFLKEKYYCPLKLDKKG